MNNKYIVYQNPYTNGIETLTPCINDLNEVLKDIPKNNDGLTVQYKFIDYVPSNIQTYDFIDNEIIRNRYKLHEFKKNDWRNIRKKKLEYLDIEFMKSIETSNITKQDEIKRLKESLRDVTNIDVSFLSDNELENYTPSILIS
jgi:hypothetical protein